jgi:hypothetical protein
MPIYAVVIIVIMAIVKELGVPFHINELVFSLHYLSLCDATVGAGGRSARSNIQAVQVQADFVSLCLFNLGE